MDKIGRNESCPCGSGKKYKRCCANKEHEMRQRQLPPGRFRYEPGSYGRSHLGYMPSIICYKETGPESWTEHFILVKGDVTFAEEDGATALTEEHLAAASRDQAGAGGNPREFALSCVTKDIRVFPISGSSDERNRTAELTREAVIWL
jgi:SEC-C motif